MIKIYKTTEKLEEVKCIPNNKLSMIDLIYIKNKNEKKKYIMTIHHEYSIEMCKNETILVEGEDLIQSVEQIINKDLKDDFETLKIYISVKEGISKLETIHIISH